MAGVGSNPDYGTFLSGMYEVFYRFGFWLFSSRIGLDSCLFIHYAHIDSYNVLHADTNAKSNIDINYDANIVLVFGGEVGGVRTH